MGALRGTVLVAVTVVAAILQVSFFGFFSYRGVVPNLVLLVVVATALARGPEVAAALGLAGGLVLDLMPPADHIAGRWALALVVVGYLAGRVRVDAARSSLMALGTVLACSFVGTSLFALSGMLLRDPSLPASDALGVIPVGMGYDLLLAPFVLPLVLSLMRRLHAPEVAYAT